MLEYPFWLKLTAINFANRDQFITRRCKDFRCMGNCITPSEDYCISHADTMNLLFC